MQAELDIALIAIEILEESALAGNNLSRKVLEILDGKLEKGQQKAPAAERCDEDG